MGEEKVMICPVCGHKFNDIATLAEHLRKHAEEDKRRKEEEEKRRLADQRKVDEAKLETLKKAYEVSMNAFVEAKENFEKKYGVTKTVESDDFFNVLHEILYPYSWRTHL